MSARFSTPWTVLVIVLFYCLAISEGVYETWDNKYDEPLSFSCYEGHLLRSVESVHNNYYEDRQWRLGCSYSVKNPPETTCQGWTNWANGFDNVLNFKCPPNYAIYGVQSYHVNYYEDRKWKFRCCRFTGFKTSACRMTDWVNNWDGRLFFEVPKTKVIAGWYSVHDNYYEDRRHKFYVCDYSR